MDKISVKYKKEVVVEEHPYRYHIANHDRDTTPHFPISAIICTFAHKQP